MTRKKTVTVCSEAPRCDHVVCSKELGRIHGAHALEKLAEWQFDNAMAHVEYLSGYAAGSKQLLRCEFPKLLKFADIRSMKLETVMDERFGFERTVPVYVKPISCPGWFYDSTDVAYLWSGETLYVAAYNMLGDHFWTEPILGKKLLHEILEGDWIVSEKGPLPKDQTTRYRS
jgi:hypothetical protein